MKREAGLDRHWGVPKGALAGLRAVGERAEVGEPRSHCCLLEGKRHGVKSGSLLDQRARAAGT